MRKAAIAAAICVSCAFVWLAVAHGQFRGGGPWAQAGGNAQLTGWQQSESRITLQNAKNIQQQWDIKLEASMEDMPQPTEPLFVGRVITEKGFKDMAVVLDGHDIYDVDFELGRMIWQKHFDIRTIQSAAQVGACPDGQFAVMTVQPPPNFRRFFGARGRGGRGGRGGRRGFRPPPPVPVSQRRVGGTASGGSPFGLRGLYVLTSNGNLQELLVTNGEDYGFPVKVLPYRNSNLSAMTMNGSDIFFNTSGNCGGSMKLGGTWDAEPNGTWSVNMSSPKYPVTSYNTHNINATGLSGPAQSTDNKTLYVTTGGGQADVVTGGVYPNSVVALNSSTMQVEDYYQPSGSAATAKTNTNVSPVVFAFGGHDLIAAYVEGRVVLLDSKSLGGANHHTPLASSALISANDGNGAWGRLASAELNNTRWIYLSVQGPRSSQANFPTTHGATPNGSVVAFEVQSQGGKTILTPEWVSSNMLDPSPAVIASGIVFSLANGKAGSSNAKLYAMNATTGAPLYNSGNGIKSPGYFSSLSESMGHVLFVTENDTLYSYGINAKGGY